MTVGAAGAFAAGLLGATAAPALAVAPVVRAPMTQAITFTGDSLLTLGALSCPSKPDANSLTVLAESTVTFINSTDRTGSLQIDGAASATLRPGEGVPVVFHRGPVQVKLVPTCTLGLSQPEAATIKVTAAPAPAPSATNPGQTGGGATGGAAQPSSGATNKSSGATSGRGTGATSTKNTSSGDGSDEETDGTETDDETDTGTTGTGGDPGTLLPSQGPSDAASVTAEPAAVAAIPQRATGLLALFAIVSVVGVIFAAIRAIIAQRATRMITA